MKNNNYTLVALGVLGIISFITGITAFVFQNNSDLDLISAIILAIVALGIIFWWYVQDTNNYQYKRSPLLNMCILVVGFIGLPYYFFRSRGFKGGIYTTLIFIVVLFAWSTISYAGSYVAWYTFAVANGT